MTSDSYSKILGRKADSAVLRSSGTKVEQAFIFCIPISLTKTKISYNFAIVQTNLKSNNLFGNRK
jgi:hypothetical protein